LRVRRPRRDAHARRRQRARAPTPLTPPLRRARARARRLAGLRLLASGRAGDMRAAAAAAAAQLLTFGALVPLTDAGLVVRRGAATRRARRRERARSGGHPVPFRGAGHGRHSCPCRR
jgi:hypothetical protein